MAMAMGRSTPAVLCTVVVMFMALVLISPASAHSPCSTKPQKFVIYEQASTGASTAYNTRVVTKSPLGKLVVLAQPTTIAKSASSKRVGTTYGSITQLTGGAGSNFIYFVADLHIDGKMLVNGYKTVQFKGTILSQGATALSDPNPTTAIVGGTGDFLYAKGVLISRLVAGVGGGAHATYQQEITVWCERPE